MENFGSWSILTTNFLFVLYLALGGVTFSSILHLANGKWRFQVRHIACSLWWLFPLAGIMLIALLANKAATFPWMAHYPGEGAHHMPGWLNPTFLVAREIVGFIVVAAFYWVFIKWQRATETDESYAAQRRFRNIALLTPAVYVLYGTMVAWDFEMTQLPGWHSASYGFYHFQSNFHMFLGFFTILLFVLNGSGKLAKPFQSHIFNYMAQFMLAMTILWTYLYFTQYLIMWYGRLPEEMIRYNHMMLEGFGPLWWTFLTLKFIIPFTTLAITPNRHNPSVIVMVATSIVIGTWIERYTWIVGSADPKYYHFPMTSFIDIIYTAVVAGAVVFAIKWSLTHNGLVRA